MTRVQKEIQRTEYAPVFVCDREGCESETASMLAPAGWLVLRVARDPMGTLEELDPSRYDRDFCSLNCLKLWAYAEQDR